MATWSNARQTYGEGTPLSATQQSAGYQIMQAQYTIASQFVDPSNEHIDSRFFEDGKLLPPSRIASSDISIYNSQLGTALVDRPYVSEKVNEFRDALQRIGVITNDAAPRACVSCNHRPCQLHVAPRAAFAASLGLRGRRSACHRSGRPDIPARNHHCGMG